MRSLLGSVILIFVIFVSTSQAQQQTPERDVCLNINVSDANTVFRCINAMTRNKGWFTNRHQACSDIQGAWMQMLEVSGINRSKFSTNNIPSCGVLAEAMRLATGAKPIWFNCMLRGQRAGTERHIRECLEEFVPGAYSGKSAASLDGCSLIYSRYETGLKFATPSIVNETRDLSRETRLDPSGIPRDPLPQKFYRYGPSPLDDPEVMQDWQDNPLFLRMRRRDCSVATSVARALNSGSMPAWAACMNYEPSKIGDHLRSCLGSASATFNNCQEGRSFYEQRLRSANGGNLPGNYTPAPCDVLEPFLKQIRPPPPVVYEAPPQPSSGWGFGSVLIGVFVFIGVAGIIVYTFVGSDNVRKIPPHSSELAPDDRHVAKQAVTEMFDKKEGTLWFTGFVDKELWTQFPDNKSGNTRAHAQFQINRSIAAMPHREREAARILEILRVGGLLTERGAALIRFGLVWGDGKGSIRDYSYSVNAHAQRQYGLNSIADLINHFGRSHQVTTESAISDIFRLVTELKDQFPEDEFVKEADARLTGGAGWLNPDSISGTVFEDAFGTPPIFLGMGTDGDKFSLNYFGEGSLITVAPPGSGKTQCHVLPNLLSWPGAAVVLDVTGDLWRSTSAWREANVGPVIRFNPLDARASHSYNPLDQVRREFLFVWEDARLVAEMLVIPQSKNEPYWENSARDMITAAVVYVCCFKAEAERTIDAVLDVISGADWIGFLETSFEQTDIRSLRHTAMAFGDLDPKTRSGIAQTAMTALSPWRGNQVPLVTQRSDWQPDMLRDGSNPTIYLCLTPIELQAYAGLVRVVIAQHIKRLMELGGGREAPWIQFFLDELPQLGNMKPIQQALDVGRNHHLRIWMFAQYVSQLEDAYGKDIARGMIGACGVRIYMNAALADGTAERISDEIGMFESVIDARRRRLVEPQDLAGPDYRDRQIVLAGGALPARPLKVFAHKLSSMRNRIGESDSLKKLPGA